MKCAIQKLSNRDQIAEILRRSGDRDLTMLEIEAKTQQRVNGRFKT